MPQVNTTDGIRITYARMGRGPTPVLFIHGWIGSGAVWQDVVKTLPKDKFTLFLPDQRGTGFSSQPEKPEDYTLDRMAEDMVALITNESDFERKWIIVGHSMGALVAQRLAGIYARRIAGLVLIAPIPMTGADLSQDLHDSLDRVLANKELAPEVLGGLFAETPDEEVQDLMFDDMEGTAEVAVKALCEMWKQGGDESRLRRIKAPALVIAGGKDPIVPPERAREKVATPLKDAELTTYDDVGHMIVYEAPDRLAADIRSFAEKLGE